MSVASEEPPAEGPDEAGEAEGESEADEETEPAPLNVLERHETGHWEIAGFAALLAIGAGVLFSQPALLLVAAVAVGLAAHRQAATQPSPALSMDRSFEPEEFDPGDVIEVETTIRNVGEKTLADCRFVDLVPDELSVVEGSPRRATTLRPGQRCTITYAIRVRRGRHTFDGVYAILSNLAGTAEDEYHVGTATELDCVPTARPL